MATRAMAGGVACLAHRRWAKAAAGQGRTAARGVLRSRGARRGRPGPRRSSRGVRRRHSPATTATRRRSDGGGAGIEWERGQEGRGELKEAHCGVQSGGEGPEDEDRRRGGASAANNGGGGRLMALGGGVGARELRWEAGIPFPWSVGQTEVGGWGSTVR